MNALSAFVTDVDPQNNETKIHINQSKSGIFWTSNELLSDLTIELFIIK